MLLDKELIDNVNLASTSKEEKSFNIAFCSPSMLGVNISFSYLNDSLLEE